MGYLANGFRLSSARQDHRGFSSSHNPPIGGELVTRSFPAGVDGVGQPVIVSRYSLYTAEQAAAAAALADQIRERGLRTVRLIVVHQHAVPRGKAPSPHL